MAAILDFVNFKVFSMDRFLGVFFTHYRGINEVISIEKPFPSIYLNLFALFTGLVGLLYPYMALTVLITSR
jgi:hypothetical protein